MQNRKLSEEDIQKFMQGCEDLAHLGGKFTDNIREAITDLKKTYDPALKSQYIDPAVVELLTQSLQHFEKKVESNLEGIEKICTKGGKWFAFYLGRSVEKEVANEETRSQAAGQAAEDSNQTKSSPLQMAKRSGNLGGSR